MEYPKQIEKILKKLSINQTGLANKLGVSRGIVSEFANGAREPSKEFLIGITKLGISLDWFLTGKGEMLIAENLPNQELSSKISDCLSPKEELTEISTRITNIAERLTQPLMVPSRLQPLVEIATNLDDARLNQVIGSARILYDQQKGELTDSQNAHLSAG